MRLQKVRPNLHKLVLGKRHSAVEKNCRYVAYVEREEIARGRLRSEHLIVELSLLNGVLQSYRLHVKPSYSSRSFPYHREKRVVATRR